MIYSDCPEVKSVKSSFKKDIIACAVALIFFSSFFVFAVICFYKDALSLKNWDKGVLQVKTAVCTNFYLYKTNHGDSWEFEFSDGSYASISYNVQTEFDEEHFKTIMHLPLDYVYAKPSKILVDIKDGDTSLLNQEYSRTIINKSKTSSAFSIFMMLPLPMFPICLFAYALVKHKKNRKK